MKEPKTLKELIMLLKDKGVIISNEEEALKKIKKYSYYSIVNTYKDVFKDTNGNYKKNVTFDEIFALYSFDKNIRYIFLKYTLEIEVIIKALLSENIISKYGLDNFLVFENFDTNMSKQSVEDILNRIKDELSNQNGKHDAVTHYMQNYGFMPPYILTKILTFGELSKLYGILKQEDRQAISKEFKMSDKLLKQILINLSMIRNICAHNDRLYSFHSKFLISYKKIDKNYERKANSTNIYIILKCMEYMLDSNNSKKLKEEINNEIIKLEKNLNSIDINIILNLMGFPKNN